MRLCIQKLHCHATQWHGLFCFCFRLIGAGAFGEVYLARWHSSEVAVKCLTAGTLAPDGGMGSHTTEAVADLMREADILASLRHPNVVAVYGVVLPPNSMMFSTENVISEGMSMGCDACLVFSHISLSLQLHTSSPVLQSIENRHHHTLQHFCWLPATLPTAHCPHVS